MNSPVGANIFPRELLFDFESILEIIHPALDFDHLLSEFLRDSLLELEHSL